MKLLGWMHRKFRQNSGDVFKDFPVGGTCNCLSGRPSLEEHNCRRRQFEPFPERSLRVTAYELFDAGVVGGDGGGDPAVEELFGGLLTIGTLGIGEWTIEEGEAPTVAVEEEEKKKSVGEIPVELMKVPAGAVDAIAEKEAAATTETDLMVLSVELEKMLAAEVEKDNAAMGVGDRISSARPSHVSGGEAATACPLQGFLFGFPIEMAETTAAESGRRERRASLGELFMRSRMAEEGSGGKRETTRVAGDGSGGVVKPTAGMHVMMNKILKRRESKGSYSGPSHNPTVETKFQKILQIFHRKVHPESCFATKKHTKTGKNGSKEYLHLGGGKDKSSASSSSLTTSNGTCWKENIPSFTCCSNPPSFAFSGSDSNGNRGHWIKTDANYLVLEL